MLRFSPFSPFFLQIRDSVLARMFQILQMGPGTTDQAVKGALHVVKGDLLQYLSLDWSKVSAFFTLISGLDRSQRPSIQKLVSK